MRIPLYAMRAALARDKNMGIKSPKFIQYGSSILLVAGYLFFVQGVLSLTLAWIMQGRNIQLSKKNLYILYASEHLLCLVITILGIVGAIIFTGANSDNDIKQSRILKVISGGLFAALIISLLFLTIMHSTISQTKTSATAIISKPKHKRLQIFVLLFLQICLLVEAIYRIWSAIELQGFIIGGAAVPIFVFLPETLSVLTLLIAPLKRITSSSQDSITEEE